VLCAFEKAGFRASAYAAASSSVIPAAAAAVGKTNTFGLEHWLEGLRILERGGQGMSGLALQGIQHATPLIVQELFQRNSPRFLIAMNFVDEDGAIETQGKGARRLGRLLLLSAARGDRSWIDHHLTLQMYDSRPCGQHLELTASNFADAAYASSRVLHAWDIPAWVDGMPYVDAFYTCTCPVYELAASGCSKIFAISNEPILYRDIFQDEEIHEGELDIELEIIRPSSDLLEFGVSYTSASADALEHVFNMGLSAGLATLSRAEDI
jgi:hypothetical protein